MVTYEVIIASYEFKLTFSDRAVHFLEEVYQIIDEVAPNVQ